MQVGLYQLGWEQMKYILVDSLIYSTEQHNPNAFPYFHAINQLLDSINASSSTHTTVNE